MMTSVAIEINKQYVKLAVVNKGTKHLDCFLGGVESFSDEQVIQKIIDMLRGQKIKAKGVTLCLSRDSVTVRNLHLPSRSTKEIAQMIDLHIARVVPYKKEEIVFSHQFLGADEMGYARVLLAIVQIEVIRRLARILEKAGLFVEQISFSSWGLWQWVNKNCHAQITQGEMHIILDVDSLFSDFIIFSQQGFLFTRSIGIGSSSIRQSSQQGLVKLIGELKQSLVIFYNEEINKKPVKIFLSGATDIPNFPASLEAELGIPVKAVPAAHLREGLNSQPADASLNALAGVALAGEEKGLSFILPEIQIKKSIRDKTRELIIVGSFTVYILFLSCAIFLGKIYNQQAYLRRLTQNYGRIERQMGDLMEQSKKIRFVKDYLSQRRLPMLAISQLQRMVPDNMLVNFMSISQDHAITLRGQAVDLADVFKFIGNLEKSNYFYDIKTKHTRKKKVKNEEVTDFELAIKLREK